MARSPTVNPAPLRLMSGLCTTSPCAWASRMVCLSLSKSPPRLLSSAAMNSSGWLALRYAVW